MEETKLTNVVGTFKKSRNFGFVVPDDRKIKEDIFISKSNWGKAKNNQKVVVSILKQPIKGKKAEGKIIEILGYADETGVDMLSIIRQYNLPYEFSNEVIREAKNVSKEPILLKNRVDFRNEEIFTIDGEDAKDLDDAVCVNKNSDGTFTLGVHIADVSNYVREGSELNKEALNRATSVYMLDRVIPMLPTELSNGICSLNQHEDRYAISVIMKINQDGKVIDSDIKKSVIRVTRRMNYHEVSDIISLSTKEKINNNEKKESINEELDNKFSYVKNAKRKVQNKTIKKANISSKLEENLKNDELKLYGNKKDIEKLLKYADHFNRMEELSKILKTRRQKDGYLSLDIPESKITLDKFGHPIKVEAYETTIANEIIEQFMLTANEVVAERFYWLNAPFIYRVHEKPEEEKIVELNKALFNFGYKLKGKKDDIKPKAFSQILEDVKGKTEEKVVSNLLLRTLKIARYEAENKGHFGIASKYYCHFTSPIRRYPDLFIHRIISMYIENNYDMDEYFAEKYGKKAIKYAMRSSECEQNATKAERDCDDMKMAEYMEDKIGSQYNGIISSVTNFGMFVELPNTVEGLVRFENINGDYFKYNEANKTLIGKTTKKVYKLGDKVRVEVIDANKELRRVDFKIAEPHKTEKID